MRKGDRVAYLGEAWIVLRARKRDNVLELRREADEEGVAIVPYGAPLPLPAFDTALEAMHSVAPELEEEAS